MSAAARGQRSDGTASRTAGPGPLDTLEVGSSPVAGDYTPSYFAENTVSTSIAATNPLFSSSPTRSSPLIPALKNSNLTHSQARAGMGTTCDNEFGLEVLETEGPADSWLRADETRPEDVHAALQTTCKPVLLRESSWQGFVNRMRAAATPGKKRSTSGGSSRSHLAASPAVRSGATSSSTSSTNSRRTTKERFARSFDAAPPPPPDAADATQCIANSNAPNREPFRDEQPGSVPPAAAAPIDGYGRPVRPPLQQGSGSSSRLMNCSAPPDAAESAAAGAEASRGLELRQSSSSTSVADGAGAKSSVMGRFASSEQVGSTPVTQRPTFAASASGVTARQPDGLGGARAFPAGASFSALPPREVRGGSSKGPADMWSQALFVSDGDATEKPRTWSQALFNENEGGQGVLAAAAGASGGGKGAGGGEAAGWGPGSRGIGSKGRKVRPGSVTPSPPGSRPLSRQDSGFQPGVAGTAGAGAAMVGGAGGAVGIPTGLVGAWLEDICQQSTPKSAAATKAAAAAGNAVAIGSSNSTTPKQQQQQQEQVAEQARVVSPAAIVSTSRLLGSPFASRIPAVPVYHSPGGAAAVGGAGGHGNSSSSSKGLQGGAGGWSGGEEEVGSGSGRQGAAAKVALG